MQSEVARMREQIERECRAMQNAGMYASVSRHATIQKSLRRIEGHTPNLAKVIGDTAATEVLCEVYQKVIG